MIGASVQLLALPDIPVVEVGDDLVDLILQALVRADLTLQANDVLVITSKIVSRSEGRFVCLADVTPTRRAEELAAQIGKDPRLVTLILAESTAISRTAPGVVIVRHRCGVVSANAGIDASNVGRADTVLLLPEAPDASAERIRKSLADRGYSQVGIVLSDSLGRPFRAGTVGHAIGAAGVECLGDRRGTQDLYGRDLEHTWVATADQLAAAADMVAGQAAQGRPVVLIRGVCLAGNGTASELIRPPEMDLYA